MKADLELTITMMGDGKPIKDHSQVSFRTDRGSLSWAASAGHPGNSFAHGPVLFTRLAARRGAAPPPRRARAEASSLLWRGGGRVDWPDGVDGEQHARQRQR